MNIDMTFIQPSIYISLLYLQSNVYGYRWQFSLHLRVIYKIYVLEKLSLMSESGNERVESCPELET